MPPLWPQDPQFSSKSKNSFDTRFKPSREEEKKDAEDPGNKDCEVPSREDPRVNQEQDASVNITNTINIVSPTINDAGIEADMNKSRILVLTSAIDENIVYGCADDPKADMNNLSTFMPVSPILTTRHHKDRPLEQIIGDLNLAPQTRRMTRSVTEHEPKKVWTLVDLPHGKRAIGTKWVYKNKKDKSGIIIKNKARLVAQGYIQEEGIDYDEVFAPVARIEAIRLFLVYASFKDFVVYQMDVKSAFLYGKIEKEVYVCQPPRFEDLEFPDRVYKVEK
ncbi:putative ribonuclease H-like domain-containing protein, partial [Tanacetum coccineum]